MSTVGLDSSEPQATRLRASATAPSARGWHDMAYEAESGLIVLFGGGPGRGSFTDETWLYDPATNTWREWSSP